MKSYNGLFEQMLDRSQMKAAILSAAKGKTKRRIVIGVIDHIEDEMDKITDMLRSDTWSPPKHVVTTVLENTHRKAREISKPLWKYEQIIHHMLIRQVKPIVMSRLGYHIYGSVPKRGTHSAVKTMVGWARSYKKRKFYVAELDIKKFYDNVDTDILKELLRKQIRDKAYLNLMFKIIDCHPKGLPLGNYTSPWLANYYLIGMDNYIMQELQPDHYLRYMDNIFMFHTNKRALHKQVKKLREWLRENRNLEIKKNWQVFRFETNKGKGRPINALGFMIHYDRVTVRKGILKRMRRKAKRMGAVKGIRYKDACSMVSRMGYTKHTDTKGYVNKYISPNVSISLCQHLISRRAKAINNAITSSLPSILNESDSHKEE